MSVSMTHYFGIGLKLTDDPDFDKYDELEGYHSKIGGEILKKAPFETVKDYCEAANAAMKKIEKN